MRPESRGLGVVDMSDEDSADEEQVDFNVLGWSSQIPLCDDMWLGMQMRNIAFVDLAAIRDMEAQALQEFLDRERTPIHVLLILSAISQMWIFNLYETLRTWRQRAKEIIDHSERFLSLGPREADEYMDTVRKEIERRSAFVRIAPNWNTEHYEKIGDREFVGGVRAYMDLTENVFRQAEALRVTLAKHEIPRTRGLFAEAPGYGRMNTMTGSMYWMVTLKDETGIIVDRRRLANEFFGIDDDA